MINVDLAWLAKTLELPSDKLVNFTDNEAKQSIKYVVTDSRTISSGEVFIALKGDNFDGSKFVAQVAEKGAIAAVVETPQEVDIPQFIVDDALKAYGKIAGQIAAESNVKTIAVTGSVGKTTVKEMCAAILAQAGKVLATEGNFNNEIGVPHTLMRFEPDYDFAVVELGANHVGEIAYTTSLTKPDVAILNNVAEAHLEGFGGIAGVVKAKGEIFLGLPENGTAIVNGDSEHKGAWLPALADKNMNTVQFSVADSNLNKPGFVGADNVSIDESGCAHFNFVFETHDFPVQLVLPGKHNVANALAACSACLAIGATEQQIQAGLRQMEAVKGRVNVQQVSSQLTLIDDTYNANVGSIKAAIDLLSERKGLRILVLGDMAELGDESEFYHKEIGEYAKAQGLDDLYTCGVDSKYTAAAFFTSNHFSEQETLVSALQQRIELSEQPLTLLFKGSRSAQMERALQMLMTQLDNKNKG